MMIYINKNKKNANRKLSKYVYIKYLENCLRKEMVAEAEGKSMQEAAFME